jgi:hypothetical protein
MWEELMNQDRAEGGADKSHLIGIWLVFLLRSWAATVEMFLHWGGGRRWPGMFGLGGMILLFFFGLLYPGRDIRPVLGYLAAYVVACLFTRTAGHWGSWRGQHEYGWYTGRPWLLKLVPWVGELRFKQFVEPVLVYVAAMLVIPWSEPLGAYLLGAALSLFLTVNAAELGERKRALDMYDAAMLQRQLAGRFREIEGRW